MSNTNKRIIMLAIIAMLAAVNMGWSISSASRPGAQLGGVGAGGSPPERMMLLW